MNWLPHGKISLRPLMNFTAILQNDHNIWPCLTHFTCIWKIWHKMCGIWNDLDYIKTCFSNIFVNNFFFIEKRLFCDAQSNVGENEKRFMLETWTGASSSLSNVDLVCPPSCKCAIEWNRFEKVIKNRFFSRLIWEEVAHQFQIDIFSHLIVDCILRERGQCYDTK